MSYYYGDDTDLGDRMEADQLMAALEARARAEAKAERIRKVYLNAAEQARSSGSPVTLCVASRACRSSSSCSPLR